MKKILYCTGLSLAAFGLFIGCGLLVQGRNDEPTQKRIIKQVYFVEQTEDDAKEFMSVVFTVGKDTFALDYLTLHEYDSVFNIAPIQYYKSGDILYPSYACSDTLIVVDGPGLSKGMAFIEQGIIDGTDGDIDSILHSYSLPYTKNGNIQPSNFQQ